MNLDSRSEYKTYEPSSAGSVGSVGSNPLDPKKLGLVEKLIPPKTFTLPLKG